MCLWNTDLPGGKKAQNGYLKEKVIFKVMKSLMSFEIVSLVEDTF